MRTQLGSQDYADLAEQIAPKFTWDRARKTRQINGVKFRMIGKGSERVALRGPDGVIYKVDLTAVSSPGEFTQQTEEVDLFDKLSAIGVQWVPDYWPWTNAVLAMLEYRPLRWSEMSQLERQGHSAIIEMNLVNDDVWEANVARDANGNLVLIDGGLSHPEHIKTLAEKRAAA